MDALEKTLRPIGFFDSGIGGLSILNATKALLPHENTVYIADRKNCPYGRKAVDEIIALSRKNTNTLLSYNCKMIVVACNTATAAAIDTLRREYNLPFIGLEPAVKPAALHSQTGVIGVLATHGTFNGRLFNETSKRFASHVTIRMVVADGWVELVESGNVDSDEAKLCVERYVRPLVEEGADYLVLGCTHYPALKNLIQEVAGSKVKIIDTSKPVAHRIWQVLSESNLLNLSDDEPSHITLGV